MKITTKTTKEQLVNFLGENATAVKEQDKDLHSRVAYAEKMFKKDESKVQRKDLVDLAKEVIALLGDKIAEPALQPVAENSVKKLAKGVSKKQEIVPEESGESEETAEETQEEPVEKSEKTEKVDKKSAKKSLGKKKEPKEGVTVLEGTEKNSKTVQMAKMFPQTLEVGEDKYNLAEDIKTFDDLYEALGKDEDIVFAYYWTKRHLKQFPYFGGWLGQPKSFTNDLDLATVIYVSDEKAVSYQISMYTEAIYTILPADFEEEDGIRVAGGIEYQIYRKAV